MVKTIITYLVISVAITWLCVGISLQIATEKPCNEKPLQDKVDSLQSEINVMSIEKGRYEYMIDVIRNNDSIKVDSLLKNIE